MNFNGTNPFDVSNPDSALEKIRTRIRIMETGKVNGEFPAIGSTEFLMVKVLMLPEVMEKGFIHRNGQLCRPDRKYVYAA